jgi:hypothetical protein
MNWPAIRSLQAQHHHHVGPFQRGIEMWNTSTPIASIPAGIRAGGAQTRTRRPAR